MHSEFIERFSGILTVSIDAENSHGILFQEFLNYIIYLHLLKLHLFCCSTRLPSSPDINFLLQFCYPVINLLKFFLH